MDRYLHFRSIEVLTVNLSDETSSETETKKLMAFCNYDSNESTQVFFFFVLFWLNVFGIKLSTAENRNCNIFFRIMNPQFN